MKYFIFDTILELYLSEPHVERWYWVHYVCNIFICIIMIVNSTNNSYATVTNDVGFLFQNIVQDCSNSSALAIESVQSCTKPSSYR